MTISPLALPLLLVALAWSGWHTVRLMDRSDWDAAAGAALIAYAAGAAICWLLRRYRPRPAMWSLFLLSVLSIGVLSYMFIEGIAFGFDLETATVAGALLDVFLSGLFFYRHALLLPRVGEDYAHRRWKRSHLLVEHQHLRASVRRRMIAAWAPSALVLPLTALLHDDALLPVATLCLGGALIGMILTDASLIRLSKVKRRLEG
jgi:hypothetical protein